MDYEHSARVAAPADRVYAALSRVPELPRFVPQITAARSLGDDRVEVEARYEGVTRQGHGWLRADDTARRIEWGTPSSNYRGWLQVAEAGEASTLTLHLHLEAASAPDTDVAGTLDAIRRLVEAEL